MAAGYLKRTRAEDRLGSVTGHMLPVHVAPTTSSSEGEVRWDVVLANGRVIDPASATDAILNVAIAGDRIAAIGPPEEVSPEHARESRDCTGLVVSPCVVSRIYSPRISAAIHVATCTSAFARTLLKLFTV